MDEDDPDSDEEGRYVDDVDDEDNEENILDDSKDEDGCLPQEILLAQFK